MPAQMSWLNRFPAESRVPSLNLAKRQTSAEGISSIPSGSLTEPLSAEPDVYCGTRSYFSIRHLPAMEIQMFAKRGVVMTVALSLWLGGVAVSAPMPIKASNTWKGSVADEKLQKEMPENGVITNAKEFEKLIKAWMVAEKVPEVNFEKELVLVATTVGSKLNLSASLSEKGDLKSLGFGTQDLGPGFRYVIISVPKEGVKTVNGKALPK
jgi:hypothetical protein